MANYGAWRVTYTEGQWVVLSGPSSMVVMEPAPTTASELLDKVWAAVLGAESITALAATLTGFGLDRMPSMAVLFHVGDELKALLRGGVELRDGDSGEVIATGAGVSTWREVAAGVSRVFLRLDEVDPNQLLQLPLVVGAARASAVLVDVAEPIAVGGSGEFSTTTTGAGVGEAGVGEAGVGEAGAGVAENVVPAAAVATGEPVVVPVPEPEILAGVEPVSDSWTPEGAAAVIEAASPATPIEIGDDPAAEDAAEIAVAAGTEAEKLADQLFADSDSTSADADIEEQPAITDTAEPESWLAEQHEDSLVAPSWVNESATTDQPEAIQPAETEDSLVEPSWLNMPPAADSETPVLVAMQEPRFDDDPAPAHGAVHIEPTQVLAGRPPFAPGQDPDPQVPQDDAFGTQFGNAETGTTGPFGAAGFGDLIANEIPSENDFSGFGQAASGGPEQVVPSPAAPVFEPAPLPSTPTPDAPVAPVFGVESGIQAGGTVPAPGPRIISEPSDHDGATILAANIAATHKPAVVATEDTVLASMCSQGHPNRPGSDSCRICNARVSGQASQLVNRPILAQVTTSVGDKVPVTGSVIIGRAPARSDDPDAELLRVPSPGHDISRSHVKISARDWDIEVKDLHSTNGTLVIKASGQTVDLSDGQAMAVQIGDQIDIGDGQILTITAP